MVEVGKIGDKTLVLDGRYISIFREGKLVWKKAYMAYILPDGNLYMYRRKIRITELSGNTLTDYQIKIEIGAGDPIFAHARSAGEDIRFCYYPEEEMLSYWIEKFDPVAEEAIIWVKVPEIPANSEIEIYMYYGNPTVASASDGDATFEFFDDFDGASLNTDKWSEIETSGAYSISDSILRIMMQGVGAGGAGETLATVSSFDFPAVIEAYIKPVHGDSTGHDDEEGVNLEDPANPLTYNHQAHFTDYSSNNIGWGLAENLDNRHQVCTPANAYKTGSDTYHNKWVRVKQAVDSAKLCSVYFDDVQVNSGVEPTLDFSSFKVVLTTQESYVETVHPYMDVDWVFIRKYASVEPSVSVGAEE